MRQSASNRIFREMQEIRYRLDEIEKSISCWKPQPLDIHESELLQLPDHLRKTYVTAVSLGECNATQVSIHTGRCRAIESSYLNQLTRTGWLVRRRKSKSICFRPVSRGELSGDRMQNSIVRSKNAGEEDAARKSKKETAVCQTINVKCLSTDYDGTISPIYTTREESHVPLQTRVMLGQIGRSLPVSIVTMKDLRFVVSRTPFARAWSAVGGLEMQVGKRVLRGECLESKLQIVSEAFDYAKSRAEAGAIEIEEKRDSLGRTLAFCVDWRRTTNKTKAKEEVDRIMNYSRNLGLSVITYENQPFCDVYPIIPDKGKALQEVLNELSVKDGIMYLGDSQTDNSAFSNSHVSIGIIHGESQPENLSCDYFVKFEDVPAFLRTLIARNYRFSPDFPMIEVNSSKSRQRMGAHDEKVGQQGRDAETSSG